MMLVLSIGVATTRGVAHAQAKDPSSAQADELPGRSVLEEVVVTAQKREQSAQSVPISITAFSREALEGLNLTDSMEIAAQTPGLEIGTPIGEGNNPSIALRGVGLNDFNDNNEGPVAVYVDEVYVPSLAGLTFQLFDIERVEVLRGPQGTLFGRNSTGGLIHYVSRLPTREPELEVLAGYGDYGDLKLQAAGGGPLSDRVQGRIALALHRRDPYVTNRSGPDRSEADSLAGRAFLKVDLSDSWSALAKFAWTRNDTVAPAIQNQGTAALPDGSPCSDADAAALSCVNFFGYRDTDGDPFAGAYDTNGPLYVKTSDESLRVSGPLTDRIAFTSVTAHGTVDKIYQEDTDTSPLDLANAVFELDARQLSQELRLNGQSERTNWVGGLYYFRQDLRAPQNLRFGVDLIPTFFLETLARQETRSGAAFAQIEYEWTPALSAVVGLRYTQEKKTYDYVQIDRLGGVAGTPPGTVLLDFNERTSGDLAVFDAGVFSGRVGLNWQVADDALLYASIARGFKSGGFNAGFSSAPPERLKYGDEQLTAYEIGFKSSPYTGLRLNGAAFAYEYRDLQTLTFEGVASFIANANKADIRGAELELQGSPLRGLDLILGLSYLDAKAAEVLTPSGVLRDRTLTLSPEFSVNGLFRYTRALGRYGELTPQIDVSYQDAVFFDVANQPVSRQGAYGVWNASLTYVPPGPMDLELSAWVKNATDEEYLVYTFDFTAIFGFNQQFFGPQRTFGVSARYRF